MTTSQGFPRQNIPFLDLFLTSHDNKDGVNYKSRNWIRNRIFPGSHLSSHLFIVPFNVSMKIKYFRVSDVNSSVFCTFGSATSNHNFFFQFFFLINVAHPCIIQTWKKINSPGQRFTQRAVIISYKNIYYL